MRVAIGPVAVPAKTELTFQRDPVGRWRLVVPEEATLTAERDRLLAAMGYDSMADLDRARANSPRAALRDFVLGTKNWAEGGANRRWRRWTCHASRTHPCGGGRHLCRLSAAHPGPDRRCRVAGDPRRPRPQHPLRLFPASGRQCGHRAVAAPMPEDAEGAAAPEQWKIAADTLATAPALLEAMQDLPRCAS
ncbi:MAG: hypothetical protein JKP98_20680 [Rhodobacteraceae bacterium]|nr:hypothetical protein [Paracoccaceae bacterium]